MSPKVTKPPSPLKFPKLTKKQLAKILSDMPDKLKAMNVDDENRRCMRGDYAPEPGICRYCDGLVIADIEFGDTGRIGGPRPLGLIAGWHCDDCGLMYKWAPK